MTPCQMHTTATAGAVYECMQMNLGQHPKFITTDLQAINTRCTEILILAISYCSITLIWDLFKRRQLSDDTVSNCHRWSCACAKVAWQRRLAFPSKQQELARHNCVQRQVTTSMLSAIKTCDTNSLSTTSRASERWLAPCPSGMQKLPELHPEPMLQLCHALILGQL